MNLNYNDVNYNIPFVFSNPKTEKDLFFSYLNEELKGNCNYKKKYGNADLKIILVLEQKTKSLDIKGPTLSKNLIDYSFWLPYKKIKNSTDYKKEYLLNVWTGLDTVLRKDEIIITCFDNIWNFILEQTNKL